MHIFEELSEHRYEQLVFCQDTESGLRAIVAIHNTQLGPALGGVRMYPYTSEEEAITDVLRLARGMTYKAAASGLNFGGGKSVIVGDPHTDKSESLFRAFGRFLHTLGGRYIAAEDVGTSMKDMEYIRMETPYVVGVDRYCGGSGDPSPFTALGVFQGIRACLEEVYETPSPAGRTVAIQGVGHVGYRLAELLHDADARLIVTDVEQGPLERAARELGAKVVEPDEIFSLPCDVFAPCALGAVINDKTIPRLRCRIVAGSANNVLLEPRHGAALAERGILYAPDYIINAGGLINVAEELGGYNEERARKRVRHLYEAVRSIIAISRRDGVPTNVAADTLALERLHAIGSLSRPYTGG